MDDETPQAPGGPVNDTLIEFYVIYVPDLTKLPASSAGKTDYTGNIAALKGRLNLCAHLYDSAMTFGVTKTTLLKQVTPLSWQFANGNADDGKGGSGYSATVSTTPGQSDNLFMDPPSMNAISVWLAASIFYGNASMPPPAPPTTIDPDTGDPIVNVFPPSQFSTLASKSIATHLHGNESGFTVADGVGGLTTLIDSLAMSISNA